MDEQNTNNNREFKVDVLNDELYYKNISHKQKRRRKIHERKINLKHDFNEEDYKRKLEKNKKPKLPTSLFKKIFFTALFLFIITAIIAALSLYEKKESVSNDRISLEVVGPPFIDGGEDLELRVHVQNFNKQKLELVDLVLSYKKDASSQEDDIILRRSLPDILHNQRADEKFDLRLFGKEGDVRTINVRLEYHIEGSTATFFKETKHEIIIRSTPTKVSIEGPKEAVQGQEIKIDIHFSANSEKPVSSMLLIVDYPLGFKFISSNIAPQFGNHTWSFKEISHKDNVLSISGKLSGLPGQGQSFHVKMGKQNPLKKNYIETVFNEVTHTIAIKEAFLDTKIKVNGKDAPRAIIRGGGDVDVEIDFSNKLHKQLRNIEIVAHLVGDLYKAKDVHVSRGEYNSNTKTITWNKDNISKLESLSPQDSGYVTFTMKTKDLVNEQGALLKPNFGIILDILGVSMNGEVKEAHAVARVDIVANTDLILIAKTLHTEGPFNNKGPIPPKVGEKTQYTISMQVTNSSNLVKKAKVSTFLPSYVDWLGQVYPNTEKNNISYNPTTREVIWDIGTIQPGIGIGVSRPREVSFQVDILPSLSQVDTLPALTRDIILTGEDSFTGTKLRYKKSKLTTKLSDSVNARDSRVVE